MLDQYSRNIDYIRISVTDRCNLCCTYCMPQTSKTYLRQEELLTYDEIVKLAGIYRSLGIKNVKLTGGEPLVREHVDELIFRLKEGMRHGKSDTDDERNPFGTTAGWSCKSGTRWCEYQSGYIKPRAL